MNNCKVCDDDGLNCNVCGFNPDKPITDTNIVHIPEKQLKEFAHKIADNANAPYCWQDIINRLHTGAALPFKVRAK